MGSVANAERNIYRILWAHSQCFWMFGIDFSNDEQCSMELDPDGQSHSAAERRVCEIDALDGHLD
jgi:hypothetical protein